MSLTPMTAALASSLADRLLEGSVGPVPDAYREEPRGRYHSTAAALARPSSTAEVSEVVRFAREHRVGLVPYAGGTGLVGGQTPEGPPMLLVSVERLDAVRAIDVSDGVASVEAGVILETLRQKAADAGRLFPLSLASGGSARIGGLLAANAGGTAVLRYGNARELCLGLEAVLPDGSVLHGLKRLRKDNSGYDIRNLLIGSEGTLGIITAATLRLFPQPVEEVTAMLALNSAGAALELLNRVRDQLGETLTGFELIHRQSFDFLAETFPDVVRPFAEAPEWAVLIEAGAGAGAMLEARVETALSEALEAGLIEDALIAQSRAQAAAFWEARERIPEANRLIGSISSHDISVPVGRVPDFVAEAGPAVHRIDPSLRINCFGHLGDGNLHYNVFPARAGERDRHEHQRAEISACVHDLVDRYGGSVSAEHGIGRLKTAALEHYGDPAKLAAMRAIKRALDPAGIMNPGAVLSAD